MRFKNRTQAGILLAQKLSAYLNKDVVVYALPRGGVVTAVEIARYMQAPLDVVITRKIGHPTNPEYAIGAITDNNHIVSNRSELVSIEKELLEREIEKQRKEIRRRKGIYLHGREMTSPKGKIALLVDDGVATGMTMRAGIIELKHHNPKKIVVAVPIISRSVAEVLKKEVDGLVAFEIPPDDIFLDSVGGYYEDFSQIEDSEVVDILDNHKIWLENSKAGRVAR